MCSVSSEAAGHAARFAAVARLRRLEAELQAVSLEHRELSAVRLQRWYRASCWRRWVWPRQLMRARLLVHSCIVIQTAWRAAMAHASQSILTLSTSLSPTLLPSPVRQDGESPINIALADAPPHVPAGEVDKGVESPIHVALADAPQSVPSCVLDKGADPGPDHPKAQLQTTPSVSDLHRRRSDWEWPDPRRGLSLGPGGARAAALWRGYYVRRAMSCRSLQMKIKLRHDLYLLISDVEARQQWQAGGPPPQRLGPWVDVLYTGLGRLQNEVLEGFEAVLQGPAPLWGGARLPVSWLGWPRDLRRLARLPVRKRERSPACSEPSLIASTMLQTCTPPRSPLPADGSGELLADALRRWQHDDLLQAFGGAADAAAGPTVRRPVRSSLLASEDALASPCGVAPREVFSIPLDHQVLPLLELPGHSERSAPSTPATAPASPAARLRDWSKVKPRVDAGSVRAPSGGAKAGGSRLAGLKQELKAQEALSRGRSELGPVRALSQRRSAGANLGSPASTPLLGRHRDVAGDALARVRPGEVDVERSSSATRAPSDKIDENGAPADPVIALGLDGESQIKL